MQVPDEFFRLPYDQAKSDVIRAGAIYHHGGLYLDTDFLVMQPMATILHRLDDHHIVSYTVTDGPDAYKCGGGDGAALSSNWHAGRKGNPVSAGWWRNIKSLLTRQCKPGDYVDAVDKVCCHEEGAPEKESKKCHIPWAQLEHLKAPLQWVKDHQDDASSITIPTVAPRLFCLHGRQSVAPYRVGQVQAFIVY